MFRPRSLLLVSMIAAGALACSSARRMDDATDSGPASDAGDGDGDAGPRRDVGPPMDAGMEDAGEVIRVDGGVVSCPEPMPTFVCEASLCGNGAIDSCTRCYP